MAHITDPTVSPDGKNQFKSATNNLIKSAKLCGADEAVIGVRDNIIFFDAVQTQLSKNTGAGVSYLEETDIDKFSLYQIAALLQSDIKKNI